MPGSPVWEGCRQNRNTLSQRGSAGWIATALQRLFKTAAIRHVCLSAQGDSDLSVGDQYRKRFFRSARTPCWKRSGAIGEAARFCALTTAAAPSKQPSNANGSRRIARAPLPRTRVPSSNCCGSIDSSGSTRAQESRGYVKGNGVTGSFSSRCRRYRRLKRRVLSSLITRWHRPTYHQARLRCSIATVR
jgi:hypothetical protein